MKERASASLKVSGYLEVADELRRRIHGGEWKPGDKLPSYRESRAQFGAHSVALEKAHAQLEREGLIRRERGRGTFVAQRSEKIVESATGLIGVTGKGFSFKEYSPYWVSLLRGIREAADKAEKQILLLDFKSNKGWEKADGILMCDWSNRITMKFLPPHMPCVSVLVPCAGMSSVYADDYGGGRAATEYLLSLGHRRIAYLHSRDPFVSNRRIAGHLDALRVAGIEPKPEWERKIQGRLDFGERFIEMGYANMKKWLRSGWEKEACTAILAQNDETALGMIRALREYGLRVPQDVSVVGFDGVDEIHYSSANTPHLTTMKVPLEAIGKTAMELLITQLNGAATEQAHRVYPPTLQIGETTAPAKEKG